MNIENEKVGYGKPPKASRFKKGKSGNPKGRPRKEKLPTDQKSMLERAANEELEVAGQLMTMQEIQIRALNRKAATGDVPALRLLASLQKEAGCNQPIQAAGGVLVVPGTRPLDEWSIAAARQQEKFRGKYSDSDDLE